MVFKNSGRVHNGHGNDGNIAFFGDLEAAFMEREESILGLIPGTFGENTDRNTVFHLINGSQDRFQPGLDILAVQEETVQILHPDI